MILIKLALGCEGGSTMHSKKVLWGGSNLEIVFWKVAIVGNRYIFLKLVLQLKVKMVSWFIWGGGDELAFTEIIDKFISLLVCVAIKLRGVRIVGGCGLILLIHAQVLIFSGRLDIHIAELMGIIGTRVPVVASYLNCKLLCSIKHWLCRVSM